MTGDYIVRGVPSSLVKDGWWLTCDTPNETSAPATPPPPTVWKDLSHKVSRALLALIVLVTLADWLFWRHAPGISVALFSWALFGAAFLLRGSDRTQSKPALLILLLSSLPAIEHYQALSIGFQLLGLSVAVAWIHLPASTSLSVLPFAALRLLRALPLSGLRSFFATLFQKTSAAKLTETRYGTETTAAHSPLKQHLRNWGFPLGGALVLITLLLQANPLLEQSLISFLSFDFDITALLHRVLFWSGFALMIWPFLVPTEQMATTRTTSAVTSHSRTLSFGLNAGSVLRALVVFNLLLSVQSTIDLSILFGGATLPKDMTLATYAHRGAYPLLATAMLAGAFALAARPYLDSHPSLKPLMMLWLVQNALLGLTSMLRLDLYVASFGLTYLRIYAMIWMGLVVIGLILTGWQILKRRSNHWLLRCCATLGLVTLYLCAFINFSSMIAVQNLNTQTAKSPDWYYLCTLGPTAANGIIASLKANPGLSIPPDYAPCWQAPSDPGNWREWGFRNWRINSYAGVDFNLLFSPGKAHSNEDPIGR